MVSQERASKFSGFPFQSSKAPDVVIEKNRPHQFADIPRLPFKLALKVRDHKTPFAKPVHERVQTDVIRFLCVFSIANSSRVATPLGYEQQPKFFSSIALQRMNSSSSKHIKRTARERITHSLRRSNNAPPPPEQRPLTQPENIPISLPPPPKKGAFLGSGSAGGGGSIRDGDPHPWTGSASPDGVLLPSIGRNKNRS